MQTVGRAPRGGARRRIAKITRTIEAKHSRPVPLTGEKLPVGVASGTEDMDCVHVEGTLQVACPVSVSYLYYPNVSMVSVRDFEAACGHFGLRGVIRDISREEVAEEVRARRGRGDEPSSGLLPAALDEHFPRDEAGARIAIVARRIAEAKSRAVPVATRARGAA